MLVTTTDTLQDRRIEAYRDLVIGQAVVGEDFTKQFRTGIRDIAAGMRHSYMDELERAREAALQQMIGRAEALGANAVIGVSLDSETSGETTHLVIASMAGTAVVASATEAAA